MIGQRLIQSGLIQFGAFPRQGSIVPFDLSLALIGSYPDLLRDLANNAAERLAGITVTRLLATSEAIPLGVALSLRLNVPLVYSKGTGTSPVDDLVGAYDIGHPALLITNSVGFDQSIAALVKGAYNREKLERLRALYLEKYADYLYEEERGDALEVGNRRRMVTIEVAGAFNDQIGRASCRERV